MNAVLVTGARGFVGSRLATRLRQDVDGRVLCLVRAVDGRTRHAITDQGIIASDLTDLRPDFWEPLGIEAFEAVFHLGAFSPKNAAQANESRRIIESNITGTLALLDSLPVRTKSLVFTSSIDVYERVENRVIDETSPTVPISLYGASKLFAEQLVQEHARRSGFHLSILRLGHIFGPGEDAFEKIIPNLIRSMVSRENIIINAEPSLKRDFLFVDDAVEAILRAASLTNCPNPLNIVRGRSITLQDAAQCIAKATGYSGGIHFSGPGAGRSLVFDNSRMRGAIGLDGFTSFEDGIIAEVEYYLRKMSERAQSSPI